MRLIIVDEDRLFAIWIGEVAEVLAGFIAVNRRRLSAIVGVVIGYPEQWWLPGPLILPRLLFLRLVSLLLPRDLGILVGELG